MEIFLKKTLKVSLLYWTIAAVVMSYFLFKVDLSRLSKTEGPFYRKIIEAVRMPRINLGIDLSGGSRIVYKVDVDKSIQARFTEVSRDFEKLLKRKKVVLPQKKSFASDVLTLGFLTSEHADAAQKVLSAGFSKDEYEFKAVGSDVVVKLSDVEKNIVKNGATDKAVTILRNRLDTTNVKGLLVQRHGTSKVVINLPGLDGEDLSGIKANIARSAKLEFKIVEDQASSKAQLLKKFGGVLPPDKMIVPGKENTADSEYGSFYLVSIFADVMGKNIANASVAYDEFGRPMVEFKMNSVGATQMREVSSKNIGKQFAIIMDEKVVSAPQFQSEIGGHGSIRSERFKIEEVSSMVALLKSGALDAPLIQESESRVGASLGQDSIEQGLWACLFALLLLFLFAIVWYKTAGVFAIITLVYNLLVIFACFAYLKATLTLPGIAGLVLTIGMAIDSSILIYQSIKESLEKGLALKEAVQIGFSDAFVVILDSNITTFFTGIALYFFGGPLVRGFAVTLMLGIFATVITGCFFLKAIFDFCLDVLGWKKLSI